MSLTKRLSELTLLAFVGLNTFLASWGPGPSSLTEHYAEATPSHTYLGNDYPLEYPVGPLDSVGLALHESARYTLNLSDTASNGEWRTITVYPAGFGRTRLGPSHRLFVVTMLHQLGAAQRACLHGFERDAASCTSLSGIPVLDVLM